MIENITRTIVFEEGVHSFYDDLITFLVSMTGLGTSMLIQGNPGASFTWNIDHLYTIKGNKKVSGVQFDFKPVTLLDPIINNTYPKKIEIIESKVDNYMASNIINGLQRVQASMIEASFVHYFETFRVQVETKYGSSNILWPPVWDFARVVRNAFSHGGVIEIRNPNSTTVSWKGLSYNHSNNGENIMYTDITPVEVILLMEELDLNLRVD